MIMIIIINTVIVFHLHCYSCKLAALLDCSDSTCSDSEFFTLLYRFIILGIKLLAQARGFPCKLQ